MEPIDRTKVINPLFQYSGKELLYVDKSEGKIICANRSISFCFDRLWAWWRELDYDKEKVAQVMQETFASIDAQQVNFSCQELCELQEKLTLFKSKFSKGNNSLDQATASLDAKIKRVQEEAAAATIQRCWRAYFSKPKLPKFLIARYKEAIETIQKVDAEEVQIARAESGNTPTYFPELLGARRIVIKNGGAKKALTTAKERWQNMLTVRRVVIGKGLTHLKVPKARVEGSLLVEEYLPIAKTADYTRFFYAMHPHLFDSAVREMVRLFSHIYVDDLYYELNATEFEKVAGMTLYARLDNIPVIVKDEESQVQLALIDLEQIKKDENDVQTVATLTILFPNHKDIILEEAEQLGMDTSDVCINEYAEFGRRHLQVEIYNYFTWLSAVGITLQNPIQSFTLDDQYRAKFTKKFILHFNELDEGKKKPKANPQKVEAAAVNIVNDVLRHLQKRKKKYLRSYKEQNGKLNPSDLLDVGIHVEDCSAFTSLIAHYLQGIIKAKKVGSRRDKTDRNNFAKSILPILLQTLIGGNVIYNFVRAGDKKCIRIKY